MKSLNAMIRAETDNQMVVVQADNLARMAALLRLIADTDYRNDIQRGVAKDMLNRAADDLAHWAERPE
jgi:hypothetical protein